MKNYLLILLTPILVTACVSKKNYLDLQSRRDALQTELQQQKLACDQQVAGLQGELAQVRSDLRSTENDLLIRETELKNERGRVHSLEEQLDYFKTTNTDLLARLSDLSVVSKAGAASIQQSLEALREQNKYIKDLTTSIQRKDSLNLVLVMNLKRSLADVNDEDISIEVKKGVVYISLSDKMLFRSGSYVINPRAEEVLGKIAMVVNDHNDLDILVEGHTDNVPINTNCLKDNWDLSVMRATAVTRLLQTKYGVAPDRMTAGGRSEYVPKATNLTSEGRSLNRRTEIIILPKLDQFFELLAPPAS